MAPLGAARADDHVELVDEQDDLAAGRLHLVHDGLQALLELAAELGARHERAHVEGQHAAVAEDVRHVLGDEALGEALGDGGLADAGLAEQGGVVLGAAGEGLDDALHDLPAPDDGVEATGAGQGREVDAVALQGPVAVLRPRVRDALRAAHGLEGLVHLLRVDAVDPQHLGRLAGALLDDGDEQMLRADVLVLHAVGFRLGVLEHAGRTRRRIDLRRLVVEARRALQGRGDLGPDGRGVGAHLPEDLCGHALLLLQQGQEQVLQVPLRVAVLPHHLLGGADSLPGSLREVLRS